ncbi:MAG: phosphate ABC transporter permease PstA [Christensenellales bacterium]|jgi:phosphate transport system permease protein
MKKRTPGRTQSIVLRACTYLGTFLTVSVLVFIVGYILARGLPHISADLFAWQYNSVNVSLMPALINTVFMTGLSLLVALPLGICSAIYLVEYASRSSRVVPVIRLATETLSGIPSIVYGLFGMLFFVIALKMRLSLISGALTLCIMILPLIIRTTEEALKSVPDTFREGSFGLGAGRLRTVMKIVLPSAVPGILAGVILAIGRIVGETAALIYTAGTVAEIADSLFSSSRTLSVHMYVLASEGFHINKTYATAVILLLVVLALNGLSLYVARKFSKGKV